MTGGEDFLRRCRKALKDDETGYEEGLRRAFFTSLPFCPENLLWDIFSELIEIDGTVSSGKAVEETLAAVIDLLTGEYDPQYSSLSDAELQVVCDGVNDYALDLPEDLVFSVMKTAVERGLLG